MKNNIEVTQRCCEWLCMLDLFHMYAQFPILVMAKIIPDHEINDLTDAVNLILEQEETIFICGTTSTVLFSQPQVNVLAKLMDAFDTALISFSPKEQSENAEDYARKFQQIGLIKRNLRRNEQATHFTFESPCGGNDTHHAGTGRESGH